MNAWDKRCFGCFQLIGDQPICPYCNYDSRLERSALFLPPGHLLDDQFVVGRVLGEPGGFGITYLAWDRNLEVAVAVKEFLPKNVAGRDPETFSIHVHSPGDREAFEFGREQFLAEARTVAQFNHPNLVAIRHFFRANNTAYMVMEYYDGESLSEHLRLAEPTLPSKTAVALIKPILDGLATIHEKGVLHRDLKPGNIYLASIGRPILIDFGAARFATGFHSQSLSVVLTEGYAPIEQYQRKGNQGPWTDVYGAAATLFRMLTGAAPPIAIDRIAGDPLANMRQHMPKMPRLADALSRALAVRPTERTPSAEAFIADLDLALSELGEAAQLPAGGSEPMRVEETVPDPASQQSAAAASRSASGLAQPAQQSLLAEPPVARLWLAAALLISAAATAAVWLFAQDWSHRSLPVAMASTSTRDTAAYRRDYLTTYQQKRQAQVRSRELYAPELVAIPTTAASPGILVPAFRISRAEVTVAQFAQFQKQTEYRNPRWPESPCETPGQSPLATWQSPGYTQSPAHPVVCISWHDAQTYTQWLTRVTGQRFRLPTEAEWAVAAGLSGDSARYPWGNASPRQRAHCKACADDIRGAAATGSYAATRTGLVDMAGNVAEWTCSMASPDRLAVICTSAPDALARMMVKGGSWRSSTGELEISARRTLGPEQRSNDVGFRVVQEIR